MELAPVLAPRLLATQAWQMSIFDSGHNNKLTNRKTQSDLTNKDTNSDCGDGLGVDMGPKLGQADYFSEIALTRMRGRIPCPFGYELEGSNHDYSFMERRPV